MYIYVLLDTTDFLIQLNLLNIDTKGADLSVPMIGVALYLLEEEMNDINSGTFGNGLNYCLPLKS